MSPLATPKSSIVNFQLSIGSHRLPDKRELSQFTPENLQNVKKVIDLLDFFGYNTIA